MQLVRHLPQTPSASCVATIGNFDGVHCGHQQVILHVVQQAQLQQLRSTVISFEPLPAEYFRQPPPGRIYPLRDKIQCLQSLSIDQFVCLTFDNELAALSAESFVERVLIERLQVRYLVVGDDFRFGAGRKGDYALLTAMGQSAGMQVVDMPTLTRTGARISSSLIRECLNQADLAEAHDLLGRPYQLSGRVRHGNKIGRTIGFPTLNLRMPLHLALRRGVYVVKILGLGEDACYGVANLGQRPTVNGMDCRLEVHVFNYAADAYGRAIHVQPLQFLRGEKRFGSLAELETQIQQDVIDAKTWLGEQLIAAHPLVSPLSLG